MVAIQWPVIKLGGRELIVRYSLAAQVLMGRRGVDPLRLGELTISTKESPNPAAVRNIMIVFSACVAENCLDLGNPRVNLDEAPSADYWTAQVGPGDFEAIQAALGQALGKAAEAKAAAMSSPN